MDRTTPPTVIPVYSGSRRRTVVLTALVAAGALSITVAAQRSIPPTGRGQARAPIEVVKIADNLFLLRGGGGNTAAFITTEGVVVVDSKLPGYGAPILAAIKTLTDKPIIIVINTHLHGDHVLGQLEFPDNIEYVSHENAKRGMETIPPFQSPENAGKIPKRTYKERLSLLSGRNRVELHYFGRAHTGGDTWVVFPAVGVMHAGDAVAGRQIPLVDTTFGGSAVDYPETLANAYRSTKNVKTVITGHDTTMTWAEFSQYVDFNRDLLTWAQTQMKAGKTPEQAAGDYVFPEKFASYRPGSSVLFGGMPSYLNTVFTELRAK